MADLANEGRGGAVGGQLAASERAGEGPEATGPRGEHPGVLGARLFWNSSTVDPAAAPHCVPSGRAHRLGPSLPAPLTLPPIGQRVRKAAGSPVPTPLCFADQAEG